VHATLTMTNEPTLCTKSMPISELTPLKADLPRLNNINLVRTLMPALLGNTLEFYDYACFSSLTTELTKALFPDDDYGRQLIWCIFALGQMVRPLGGIMLGTLADRHGRKRAIQFAAVGMLVATVLMGSIPVSRQCGSGCKWLGTVLLVMLRVAQGLCAGGEVAIAYALAFEQSDPRSFGVGVAMVAMSGSIAFLVASTTTTLMEMATTEEQREEWGWRLPFWLALPIGVPILWLLNEIEESREFIAMRERADKEESHAATLHAKEPPPSSQQQPRAGQVLTRSMLEHARRVQRAPLVICCGISATMASLQYGMLTYFKDLTISEHVATIQDAGLATTIAFASALFSQFLWGLLVDLYSLRAMAFIAMAMLLICAWPIWLLLTWGGHVIFCGAASAGLLCGSSVVFMCICLDIFPTAIRATAFGFSYNVGQLLFGAFAPLINNAMVDVLKNGGLPAWLYLSLGPSIWLYVATLIGFGTLCYVTTNPQLTPDSLRFLRT